MITRRQTLVGSVAAAAAGAGYSPIAIAADVRHWKAYTYVPVKSVGAVQALQRLLKSVQSDSHGQIRTQLHLAGSLPISGSNITQAVGEGVVQIADDGLATGNIPIMGILRLPMLMQSESEMLKAMKVVRPYIAREYKKKGAVLLGQYSWPPQVIFTKPKVTSLADLHGLKIRVTSHEQGALIRRLGATPITMTPSQVVPALAEGVIDGELTASSGGGVVLSGVAKWRYAFPTSFVDSNFIINASDFRKLPEKLRKAIEAAGEAEGRWATKDLEHQEVVETKKLVKAGMHNTPAKSSDIKLATEKMKPYWEKWAKGHGHEAQTVLKKIRGALNR